MANVSRPPWYTPPPWTLQGPDGLLRDVADEEGLNELCVEKKLNSSNMHVLVGLAWGNIKAPHGRKREEAGWVRFDDIVFLETGNGPAEVIFTVGPVASPDFFIAQVQLAAPWATTTTATTTSPPLLLQHHHCCQHHHHHHHHCSHR